jgi:hypothetical protein
VDRREDAKSAYKRVMMSHRPSNGRIFNQLLR